MSKRYKAKNKIKMNKSLPEPVLSAVEVGKVPKAEGDRSPTDIISNII